MLQKKYLGKLIKKAREYKSKNINKPFTQKMLADAIGKSRSYICDIERGRTYPSFPTMSSIAQVCNLPLDFFQISNEMNNTLNKFIKLQLEDLNESEMNSLTDSLKKDDNLEIDYMYKHINNLSLILENEEKRSYKKEKCANPEDIIKYIIQSKPILDFYEIGKENSKDFVDEVLNQISLISYKYKK